MKHLGQDLLGELQITLSAKVYSLKTLFNELHDRVFIRK